MSDWNFASVLEAVAADRPDAEAVIHGGRRLNWKTLNRRANAVAAGLRAAGLSEQSKVAQYLYNGPEYLETVFAAFKVGMVPVNTNYRYTAEELIYLWDNSDAEAVIYDDRFAQTVDQVRPRLAKVRLWLQVGASGSALPAWATDYEQLAGGGIEQNQTGPRTRSGDDVILVYTGGTTGMPKGVMWRQDDLFAVLNRSAARRYPEHGSVADVQKQLGQPLKRPDPRLLVGPPLMHGAGLFAALGTMCSGGCVTLLPGHRFSAIEFLETVQTERITEAMIVGDAFARPLVSQLQASDGRWNLSSLWLLVSSGVAWSAESKTELQRLLPNLTLVDSLGSSEALGLATTKTGPDSTATSGRFYLTENTKVFAEDDQEVTPGSQRVGRLAITGRSAIGYYKDPGKSDSIFKVIEGQRWCLPGDWASVEPDGRIVLLGRGSLCINTGGEKVYPDEVEVAIRAHPDIADVAVVGVADPTLGEQVVALVEYAATSDPAPEELAVWLKQSLAGYKVPRRFVPVKSLERQANGKADYRHLRRVATEAVAVAPNGADILQSGEPVNYAGKISERSEDFSSTNTRRQQ